ncbi:MAG: M23 family metallopeptidase [Alphaproteobacteria bacterium]
MIHQVLVATLFLVTSAAPLPFELRGDATQGGMMQGQVPAGTEIRLDGQPVRVHPDGHFVFGFSHDAPENAVLSFTWPDGDTDEHALTVKQRRYDEQHVKGLPPKKVTPPAHVQARLTDERGRVRAARNIASDHEHWLGGFIWPAEGRVTGVYGSRRVLNGIPKWPHLGLDVAAPAGTEVRAPAAGTVLLAHADFYYEGGIVIIDHGYGVSSTLFHLQSVDVEEGQSVAQGDRIGAMGATGRATGSHVDWRVNWHQVRLDPALLVSGEPKAP